eukprot:UN34238
MSIRKTMSAKIHELNAQLDQLKKTVKEYEVNEGKIQESISKHEEWANKLVETSKIESEFDLTGDDEYNEWEQKLKYYSRIKIYYSKRL